MQYDFTSSGLNFGDLSSNPGAFGGILSGSAAGAGADESGSGFWTWANRGLDALASLGGGWLALQQQSQRPQYQGQPEQTYPQGVREDMNKPATQAGGNGTLFWVIAGGALALLVAKLAREH